MAKRAITVQTIISGHMTGIITQTKESELYTLILKCLITTTLIKLYQIFKCVSILSQVTLRKEQKIADFFSEAKAQEYLHQIII